MGLSLPRMPLGDGVAFREEGRRRAVFSCFATVISLRHSRLFGHNPPQTEAFTRAVVQGKG
jgi:hypothetical protein